MQKSKHQRIISERLISERLGMNYTQVHVAKLIGCSQPQYGRYETGLRPITAAQLFDLAEAYQIPVDHFFPPQDIRKLDLSERQLLDAWRKNDLAGVLRLVGEKFDR